MLHLKIKNSLIIPEGYERVKRQQIENLLSFLIQNIGHMRKTHTRHDFNQFYILN